jgi:hypothetical protein
VLKVLHLVIQGLQVLPVSYKVLKEQQDRKVHLDLQVVVVLDLQVHKEHRVLQELQDQQVHKELKVHKVRHQIEDLKTILKILKELLTLLICQVYHLIG